MPSLTDLFNGFYLAIGGMYGVGGGCICCLGSTVFILILGALSQVPILIAGEGVDPENVFEDYLETRFIKRVTRPQLAGLAFGIGFIVIGFVTFLVSVVIF